MFSSSVYYPIYFYPVLIILIIVAGQISSYDSKKLIKGYGGIILALMLCIFYAWFLGMRPPTWDFTDTGTYAYTYHLMKTKIFVPNIHDSEALWNSLMFLCSRSGVPVSTFFTIVSFGYFGFIFWACKSLTPKNTLITLLFILSAFSTYTYAVNGIRNGLACSVMLAVVAMIARSKKTLPVGIALCFLALNIHRTTLLPIVTLFASVFVIKQFKWAYTFWIAAIVISIVAGSTITSFFAGLGFDERLAYIASEASGDKFSRTGFRWDFLLYSMMPILLGYYVVIKKNIRDNTYMILLNTYTLANAFWVMVNTASFSNRFAYLSWFMYPIVLAYPLLTLNIWGKKQGSMACKIMLAQAGFTLAMDLLFYR